MTNLAKKLKNREWFKRIPEDEIDTLTHYASVKTETDILIMTRRQQFDKGHQYTIADISLGVYYILFNGIHPLNYHFGVYANHALTDFLMTTIPCITIDPDSYTETTKLNDELEVYLNDLIYAYPHLNRKDDK